MAGNKHVALIRPDHSVTPEVRTQQLQQHDGIVLTEGQSEAWDEGDADAIAWARSRARHEAWTRGEPVQIMAHDMRVLETVRPASASGRPGLETLRARAEALSVELAALLGADHPAVLGQRAAVASLAREVR